MTIWIDRGGPNRDIMREIEKTEALLNDLKRFGNKQFPIARELEEAPLIDNYKIDIMYRPALVGQAYNHPRLGHTTVQTTELWAIAPTLGWARTWSRFYRLGFPADNFGEADQ